MQMQKAQGLRDAWARKGNPPCKHPSLDREYHLGADTGDVVCTTCGQTWWSNDPKRPDRQQTGADAEGTADSSQ